MAAAEREELQQLASEILVDLVLCIERRVEPQRHRRRLRNGEHQARETAEGVIANDFVLRFEPRNVEDFRIAGGEVIVPEKRHSLFERTRGGGHSYDEPS